MVTTSIPQLQLGNQRVTVPQEASRARQVGKEREPEGIGRSRRRRGGVELDETSFLRRRGGVQRNAGC